MEVVLFLCSDYIPKAYLPFSTINTILPRKLWHFYLSNTSGEISNSFSEIWVYKNRDAYDNNEDHAVMHELSKALNECGISDGNLLLFKTKNEAA